MRCRRRPTLPRPLERSTIGAVGLNDRVRDGNGCGPYALVASEDVRQQMEVKNMGVMNRVCFAKIMRESQASRAIRTATLGTPYSASTGGLSTE